MGNAAINITLLHKAALGRFLLANRLRSLDRLHVESITNLDELMRAPNDDRIIAANWDELLLGERERLLHHLIVHPTHHLVITSSSFSCADARALIQRGRCVLLDRDAEEFEIEEAILQAHEEICEIARQRAEHDAAEAILSRLTARERDILSALSMGQSNKAAARQLGLSPRTVEVHRANMIRRSGVPSLPHLMQLHLIVEKLAPMVKSLSVPLGKPCAVPHPLGTEPPHIAIHDGNTAPRADYTV
jgi:two-component system response regulator FixJ